MSTKDAMMKTLPSYYMNSSIFNNLIQSESSKIDVLNNDIDDLLNQFSVSTATWGLDIWEAEYAISKNNLLTYEERRSRITAKMRGIGTVGSALIKNVAESYANGEVSVILNSGSITIKFVGLRGIPTAIDELKKNIEEIVPCHLSVLYEYTYTTWGEVRTITWANAKLDTWQNLKTRVVV